MPMKTDPTRALIASASAKMPTGATANVQPLRPPSAALPERLNASTGSRRSGASLARASANAMVNTSSGRIAPSAAALNGFGEINASTHAAGPLDSAGVGGVGLSGPDALAVIDPAATGRALIS